MSGQLPAPMASAAQRMAHVARAHALVAGHRRDNKEKASRPGREWAAIDLQTRVVLVMLSCEQVGETRAIARQPWGSFSDADQSRIVATRLHLLKQLSAAASLF